MRFLRSAIYIVIPALFLTGCGDEELSDDPEIAETQIDERTDQEAQTLEKAAAEAVKIQEAEIAADGKNGSENVETNGSQ